MAEGQKSLSLLLGTFLKRTFQELFCICFSWLICLIPFFVIKMLFFVFSFLITPHFLPYFWYIYLLHLILLCLVYLSDIGELGGNGRWNWIFMAVWIRDILSINSSSNWLQPFQNGKDPRIIFTFICLSPFVLLSKRFSQLGECGEQRTHYQLFTHRTNAKKVMYK